MCVQEFYWTPRATHVGNKFNQIHRALKSTKLKLLTGYGTLVLMFLQDSDYVWKAYINTKNMNSALTSKETGQSGALPNWTICSIASTLSRTQTSLACHESIAAQHPILIVRAFPRVDWKDTESASEWYHFENIDPWADAVQSIVDPLLIRPRSCQE